jgi:hypothetical protein
LNPLFGPFFLSRTVTQSIVLEEILLKKFISNKTNRKQIKNKCSKYIKKRGNTFFGIFGASCLKTDRAIIPQITDNLYSVSRIILLKFQKDWSTRIKVIAWKPLSVYRQMTVMRTTSKDR